MINSNHIVYDLISKSTVLLKVVNTVTNADEDETKYFEHYRSYFQTRCAQKQTLARGHICYIHLRLTTERS